MMVNAFRTPGDQRWYRLSIAALILAAWAALVAWGASPFAGLLSHREIGQGDFPPPLRVVAFVAGWTLMTIAMMLPSSLPLLNLFRRFVADRAHGSLLLLLLGAGYLGVWAYFGLLAYLGDSLLHALVAHTPVLQAAAAAGLISAAVLLMAGLYQLTPLKTMCLERCRSPLSFLVEHWSGRHAARSALRLGLRHGLFCLGCCWTLMLLMFAVGGANLGWMLTLGAAMAAERTTRWGRRLTRPLGITLVAAAGLQAALGFPLPSV
jgi:predicted metal-binding membrane protein